jgi:hypothetical protein
MFCVLPNPDVDTPKPEPPPKPPDIGGTAPKPGLDEPNPPDEGEPNAEDPLDDMLNSIEFPPYVLPCGNCVIAGSDANASWCSSSNAIGFSTTVFLGSIVCTL